MGPTALPRTRKGVGDVTEIPTAGGKLSLATVIDLFSRRLLGAATSLHPNAELVKAALTMVVTVRGGADAIRREREDEKAIVHSDRGSTYTAHSYTTLARDTYRIRLSMGRVGSCFDNSAADMMSPVDYETMARTPRTA